MVEGKVINSWSNKSAIGVLMPTTINLPQGIGDYPCTKVIKVYTDASIGPNTGMSAINYTNVDGYRYINIFVKYSQQNKDETPVNLSVMFAFDEARSMNAGHFVNLEPNLQTPAATHPIDVLGNGTYHGDQWKISSFVFRLPVVGPYIKIFVYNYFSSERKFSVWAYFVT
jgi:hypothetical protein